MNDEIREIFDTKLYFDLEEEDYIKIKDYITNLQNENQILKDNNRNMQDEMLRTWEKLDKVMKNNYSEIKHYKFLRDIKDIIKDKEVGYMETCDILETVINKELEKYE